MTVEQVIAERDKEVHQTLSGHWHPKHVACDDKCPMHDSKRSVVFQRELMLAAACYFTPTFSR